MKTFLAFIYLGVSGVASAAPGGPPAGAPIYNQPNYQPNAQYNVSSGTVQNLLKAGSVSVSSTVAAQEFLGSGTTVTVPAPSNAAFTFVPDSFNPYLSASGQTWQFIIYAYDATLGLYDVVGSASSSMMDPNNSQGYDVSLTWNAPPNSSYLSVSNYFIYDVLNNQYAEVGNVTSYTLTSQTTVNGGSPPNSPSSIVVAAIMNGVQAYGQGLFASTVTAHQYLGDSNGNIFMDGGGTPGLAGSYNFVSGPGAGTNMSGTPIYNYLWGQVVAANMSGGADNQFIGRGAGFAITNAYDNICHGYYACSALTTGGGNTASGNDAGALLVGNASNNVAIGIFSGLHTSGNNNIAIGYEAGYQDSLSASSYTFLVDAVGRASEATKGLLYGKMNANLAAQWLKVNGEFDVGSSSTLGQSGNANAIITSSGVAVFGSSVTALTYFGDGSHLTGISSPVVLPSTIAYTTVSNTFTSSQTISDHGAGGLLVTGDSVTASAFFGDGSHLTGLPSAVLPSTVAYTTVSNTFTSSQTFTNGNFSVAKPLFVVATSSVGVNTTAPEAKFDVATGGVILNPMDLIGFSEHGNGDWGLSLGSETIPNVYIGCLTSVCGSNPINYFWRANWNTANIAGNTFQVAQNANSSLTAVEIIQHLAGDTGDFLHVTGFGKSTGNIFDITNGGNIGVNTTSPNTTLQVNGGISASTAVFTSSATASAFFGDGSHLTGISAGSSSGPFINSGNTVVQSTPSYQVIISSSLVVKSSMTVNGPVYTSTNTITKGPLIVYGQVQPTNMGGISKSPYNYQWDSLVLNDGSGNGWEDIFSQGNSYWNWQTYDASGNLVSRFTQGDPGDGTITYTSNINSTGGQPPAMIIGGGGGGFGGAFVRIGSGFDVTLGDGNGGQLDVTNSQVEINNGGTSANPFIVYDANMSQPQLGVPFAITNQDAYGYGDYVETLNNILDDGNGNMTVSRDLTVNNNLGVSGSFSSDGNNISSDGTGVLTARVFSGSGLFITNLNGSNINTGTVGSAYLPADLVYYDKTNTFTSSQTINASVRLGTTTFIGAFASTPVFVSNVSFTTFTWQNGNVQYSTLTITMSTMVFQSPLQGERFLLILYQDNTGNRTVTWPASVRWTGGTPPTLTTTGGQADIITCVYMPFNGHYYCEASQNFSP